GREPLRRPGLASARLPGREVGGRRARHAPAPAQAVSLVKGRALAILLFALGAAYARAEFSATDLAHADRLRDAGLASPLAYELVTSLTTEVGPRMAGSPGDERAVAWALATLKRLGFANVRAEPFEMKAWKRGPGSAEVTAPHPQPLVMTAL